LNYKNMEGKTQVTYKQKKYYIPKNITKNLLYINLILRTLQRDNTARRQHIVTN